MEPLRRFCACGNELFLPDDFVGSLACLECGVTVSVATLTDRSETTSADPARAPREPQRTPAEGPPGERPSTSHEQPRLRPGPTGTSTRVRVTQGQLDRAEFPRQCACCLGPAEARVVLPGADAGSGRAGGAPATVWLCGACQAHRNLALRRDGVAVASFLGLVFVLGPALMSASLSGLTATLIYLVGAAAVSLGLCHLVVPREPLGPGHGDEWKPARLRRLGGALLELEFANPAYGERFARANALDSFPGRWRSSGLGAYLFGPHTAPVAAGLEPGTRALVTALVAGALWVAFCLR
ncbi:MAG: hypothetical protein HY815_03860 [Candidatus Riflebacteria bacterium]|nr:hypothetical protein [Candidatus Riflebacteria bacterium]